jgi:hypothetical protein
VPLLSYPQVACSLRLVVRGQPRFPARKKRATRWRWPAVFHVRLDLSSPSLQELLEQGEAKRGARGGDHVACITHAPLTETENPGYGPMYTNALCDS